MIRELKYTTGGRKVREKFRHNSVYISSLADRPKKVNNQEDEDGDDYHEDEDGDW